MRTHAPQTHAAWKSSSQSDRSKKTGQFESTDRSQSQPEGQSASNAQIGTMSPLAKRWGTITGNVARTLATRNSTGADRGTILQSKLTLGEPTDKYEQEADRIAKQVVHQINTPTFRGTTPTERSNAIGSLRMKPQLQLRPSTGSSNISPAVENSIHQAKRGRQQSLPKRVQQQMGQAMGANFSGVKAHTDAQADRLSCSLGARAFTTGQHIFFKRGEYNPGSRGGQELLAHELTHVMQQNGTAIRRTAIADTEASKIQEPPSTPIIQRKLSDEVKGGAELEGSTSDAITLWLYNVPEEITPKMLKRGIKGLGMKDIMHYKDDKEIKHPLKGSEWELTVETTGTEVRELKTEKESKKRSIEIDVEMELILGGPKGSSLTDLPKIAEAAGKAVGVLQAPGLISFDEPGGKIKEAYEKLMTNWQKEHLKRSEANWEDIKMGGFWEKSLSEKTTWGLQITLGVPLTKIKSVIAALEKAAKSTAMTVPSKIVKSNEIPLSALTKKLDELEVSKDKWRTTEWDFSKDKLEGLCIVLSAYARAIDNPKESGPKKAMQLTPKNPLPQIVKDVSGANEVIYPALLEACAEVISDYAGDPEGHVYQWDDYTEKETIPILKTAGSSKLLMAELFQRVSSRNLGGLDEKSVMSETTTKKDKMTSSAKLVKVTIKEWATQLKRGRDLVAEHEKRYRLGQVGGIKLLNKTDSYGNCPVIEYRDLNAIPSGKISTQMPAIFEEIIKQIDA